MAVLFLVFFLVVAQVDAQLYWTSVGKLWRTHFNGTGSVIIGANYRNYEDYGPGLSLIEKPLGIAIDATSTPHKIFVTSEKRNHLYRMNAPSEQDIEYWSTGHPSGETGIARMSAQRIVGQIELDYGIPWPTRVEIDDITGRVYYRVSGFSSGKPNGVDCISADAHEITPDMSEPATRQHVISDIPCTAPQFDSGFALDRYKGKIYWIECTPINNIQKSGCEKTAIKRSDMDGSNIEDVALSSMELIHPMDLAIHEKEDMLYIADAGAEYKAAKGGGSIFRLNLRSLEHDTPAVLDPIRLPGSPTGIVVDSVSERLYVISRIGKLTADKTFSAYSTLIQQFWLDGTVTKTVAEFYGEDPWAIALVPPSLADVIKTVAEVSASVQHANNATKEVAGEVAQLKEVLSGMPSAGLIKAGLAINFISILVAISAVGFLCFLRQRAMPSSAVTMELRGMS